VSRCPALFSDTQRQTGESYFTYNLVRTQGPLPEEGGAYEVQQASLANMGRQPSSDVLPHQPCTQPLMAKSSLYSGLRRLLRLAAISSGSPLSSPRLHRAKRRPYWCRHWRTFKEEPLLMSSTHKARSYENLGKCKSNTSAVSLALPWLRSSTTNISTRSQQHLQCTHGEMQTPPLRTEVVLNHDMLPRELSKLKERPASFMTPSSLGVSSQRMLGRGQATPLQRLGRFLDTLTSRANRLKQSSGVQQQTEVLSRLAPTLKEQSPEE
jgi:hypothetical protein